MTGRAAVIAALTLLVLLRPGGPVQAAGSPERAQKQRLAELGRLFDEVAEAKPESIAPGQWEALGRRLDKLRSDLEKQGGIYDPFFRRDADDLETGLRSLREDLRREHEAAKARTRQALLTGPERIEQLRAAARSPMPGLDPAELERVADAAGADLELAREHVNNGRFDQAAVPADRAMRLLDEVASRDSCQRDYGLAVHAAGVEQTERARSLLSKLSGRTCLDPAIPAQAQALLAKLAAAPPRTAPSAASLASSTTAAAANPQASQESAKSGERKPPSIAPAAQAPTSRRPLVLDVWQSAWGDFTELETLLPYLRANHIRAVNFNPGLSVTPASRERARKQLRSLVTRLREGGVEEIRYLYAETSNPLSAHVELLASTPELGIDTLIDDSEFTDQKRAGFESNFATARAAGLRYGAFVTAERSGNSGVSPDMRSWALSQLDQTILMSYFGCSLGAQKEALEPLLGFADGAGRQQAVWIAILLGGKAVGRERSCERELGADGLAEFLRALHDWARSYRSYAGLVLETNYRQPRHSVALQPLR